MKNCFAGRVGYAMNRNSFFKYDMKPQYWLIIMEFPLVVQLIMLWTENCCQKRSIVIISHSIWIDNLRGNLGYHINCFPFVKASVRSIAKCSRSTHHPICLCKLLCCKVIPLFTHSCLKWSQFEGHLRVWEMDACVKV